MDEMLILRKMESLGRCVDRIRSKRGFTHEELLRNHDLQDILSVNLQRAVQLSVDIALHMLSDLSGTLPDTMGAAFIALREHGVIPERTANALRSSVGLRNVAVHDYVAVNWQIVQDVVDGHVEVFADFMREVEGWLGRRGVRK
ncbi:MAG: DUF86 domain-containing protein [Desulfovibrionales bacterium]|nr:DUF86 domain-containing protein [Desulfovibrionales bacterium]